ncbi:uncharacterized protein [Montipora foliosa]|uniref:uncharacterized protein n=1 Tax=Montipora foliosa TaxID=591990 RepID=UPI0035F1B4E1
MSDIEKETEKAVVDLRGQISDMSKSMRAFSFSMRSLYVDKAVGTSTAAARKFRKLRDDTRNDAMVYLKGILPLSTKFVASISEYFEYYEALEYEEWCKMISDILEETVGYRQLCETLLKMHEDILVPLKKRQDEATLVIAEFEKLRGKFSKKQQEFEEKAQAKTDWAHGLSVVPLFGPILKSVMEGGAAKDMLEAVAHKAEAEVQEAATTAVRVTLIPALQRFIDGITEAAGFFSVMEQEIRKFENKAEESTKDPKKLYYKVMNKQASDMKSICQAFYAVLPAVRTDFEAIPTEGTDQNYVDRWLEKQKKVIKERCSMASLAKKLVEAITAADESSTEVAQKKH